MKIIERPAPVGVARKGEKIWDSVEVAAYRKACGISQADLAGALRVSQGLISYREDPKRSRYFGAREAVDHLDAIDKLADRRQRMIVEGLATLEAVRAGRAAK